MNKIIALNQPDECPSHPNQPLVYLCMDPH